MIIKQIRYKHFGRCIYASNSHIEIIAAIDFGIRIIRFSLCGEENIFYEQPEDSDLFTDKAGWRLYGGHRLWISPESRESYYADNEPIRFTVLNDGIELIQPIDPLLEVEKIMKVNFGEENSLTVEHSIKNYAQKPKKFSVWPITTLRGGGCQVIPFDTSERGFEPNKHISLWNTSTLSDPRISFNEDRIVLRHTPADAPLKIGLNCHAGYAEYNLDSYKFSIHFPPYRSGRLYSDNNVNYEAFMSTCMTEMETLSPLRSVKPNENVSHTEKWTLNHV